ncbi:sulfate/molybdate ABC transporter ATP-binding protein [Lacrimispora saccharolytica]|uniref:ABC transporter related protein n=1 Tax=Lacrimispora saccharolytica (strain ATCC 35040 / DSM 2544 / NRCC 2533 / WM1) TaxID=610130 RepID=D9R976_LACSW|nr:ATP-binding cassette domain-containing protein [Lacrimispora saccharolytica]ADL05827.1 ABC transporter related protein [[Clostridium] saccharolyticum WM1]QRV20039.1 ATP-binding cassette domain-containing protein [Lacrimispora saccharolytica]
MSLQVNIRKKFSGFDLNVEFETDGGCMGILGASGCGKTMTLKCVAGIEKPDYGRIVLNGKVLFDSEKGIHLPARERRVGYLFQNYALFPTMTVEENLGIVVPGKKKHKLPLVAEQIRRFQLEGLEKRYPSQLSGGQQQRVALARMLLYKPDMIMLDEPFSALDGYLKDTLQMEMLELIRDYPGDVLMVSHSRDEIYKFCGHMILLSEGNTILKGCTKDIFQRPERMEAARLTGCKNISSIEKISDYQLYACDWKIQLKTAEKIGDSIRYVGIRGHNLIPAQGPEEENVMKTELSGIADTPFQRQYLFRNAEDDTSVKIWWVRDKTDIEEETVQSIPPFIRFPKEDLLLLL